MKVSPRSQEKFADFAARRETLDKIRGVYESRGFSLPEGFVPSRGRERRSLCEAVEARLEVSDPSVSDKLLLAYIDAVEDWGTEGDVLVPEARALIRSLQRDGASIDDQGRWSRPRADSASEVADQHDTTLDRRAVMVVHGRNELARRAMFGFLRAIGLKPLEWSMLVAGTGKAAPYVGEVLESAFGRAAAVVLFTPDDEARLRHQFHLPTDPPYETELTPQARPNVLFEAGMALGLHPDRTILVELGHLRPFSDVYGRHVIRINGTEKPLREIARRLKGAECDVDTTGDDWADPQQFPAPDSETSSGVAGRHAKRPSGADSDRESRRHELLRVAHEIQTELDTARHQLDEAVAKRRGWHMDDMLPAAKFDAWQKSSVTGDETSVFTALRSYYVGAHRLNVAMQARERNEYSSVGQVMQGKGLGLDDDDVAELQDLTWTLEAAQVSVQQLILRLSPRKGL